MTRCILEKKFTAFINKQINKQDRPRTMTQLSKRKILVLLRKKICLRIAQNTIQCIVMKTSRPCVLQNILCLKILHNVLDLYCALNCVLNSLLICDLKLLP